MVKQTKIIQSLNAGELSPLMDFRIDQAKYQAGCRTMENFYPLIFGGAERRPGTIYIGKAKQSANTSIWVNATAYVAGDFATDTADTFIYRCVTGHTSASSPTTFAEDRAANSTYWTAAGKVRMKGFIHSVDDAYILEFGNQYMRVFRDGGRIVGSLAADTSAWADATDYAAGDFVVESSVIYRCIIAHTSDVGGGDGTGGTPDAAANPTQWSVADLTSDSYPIYEIPTPYLTADLFELKFEHSADVSFITHPDYEKRKLSRTSHTTWTLEELAFDDGPFIDQNTDTSITITPAEIAGGGIAEGASVTLTASSALFLDSVTAGHVPSGATGAATVGTSQILKSITGALFRLKHSTVGSVVDKTFDDAGQESDELTVYKGVKWFFVSNGTWTGKITVQRSYDAGTTWEVVFPITSENNDNAKTDMTEKTADAVYKMVSANAPGTGDWKKTANCQLFTNDQDHIGVVEITAVASTVSATATVLATLASAVKTHRWSEGYWSNYRGWPGTVAISPEERLTFGGSVTEPLTKWGSAIGNYTSMKEGTLEDDAIVYTLIGSGEQNRIRWMVSKGKMVIGTYGGEIVLTGSSEDEALSPINPPKTNIQSTFGSADIQAIVVNDAILFVQRGGRKIREMIYSIDVGEKGGYTADDLTIFSNHITESGIVDMAFQRTPDPMLWCVRDDGQCAVLSYERKQKVAAWCRVITETSAGESDIESVAIIPSGSEEDVIYLSIERVINGETVRYIEYLSSRDF